MQNFDSLFDLMEAFPDEQSCVQHLKAIRWRNGEFCPYEDCDETKIFHFVDGKTFKCAKCRRRFSIKVGTIFADSKLSLRKWFMAIWLVTNNPKGMASTTLARDLKITQKSAWFVLHRLRHAARTHSFNAPLRGTVEVDETYVGGKERNKHKHKRPPGSQGGANKEVVFGVVERGGELRAVVVKDMTSGTVKGAINENVEHGSTLMTDEYKAFPSLAGAYHHHRVNHSKGEYVRHFVIHMNSSKGVWSQLKRQIVGVHHWVSRKHLSCYVDGMSWHFNRRNKTVTNRMNGLFARVGGRLRCTTSAA